MKSGGEAYIIGASQGDVKIPHNERVAIRVNNVFGIKVTCPRMQYNVSGKGLNLDQPI